MWRIVNEAQPSESYDGVYFINLTSDLINAITFNENWITIISIHYDCFSALPDDKEQKLESDSEAVADSWGWVGDSWQKSEKVDREGIEELTGE